MIRVSLGILVVAYLALFVGAILFFWLMYESRWRKRERRLLRDRLRCQLCGMEFSDSTDETLATCPRCGALNERVRARDC